MVNLLGRDGNCEDAGKWDAWQSTLALDTAKKVYGSNGLKITISTAMGGTAFKSMQLKGGKYYIVLADLMNGNATDIRMRLVSAISNIISNVSKFQLAYIKYNPASDSTVPLDLLLVLSVNTATSKLTPTDIYQQGNSPPIPVLPGQIYTLVVPDFAGANFWFFPWLVEIAAFFKP
ncbi:hypothetical protein [Desulforamulus aeronauticus]|uniref:Uncharacterized protein n=1 Tax=Desulforamulus aeronauticus DSM 10349 TaxID=1121421 RepID=A0A1M6WSV4_9FIRM|nr:hypothetical protein [Desulforamulus aeronauticus]SHK96813.1 hypothetical protein SAMN02745123_03755 [Desulforamulus aeronauticus DSM 10349]